MGYYVYVYSDPKDHKPFYIGKGKGNRVFSHMNEAFDNEKNKNSAKVKKIKEISRRKTGPKEPIIEILAYGLDEETAEKVEAAAIDLIGIKNLTNQQRGKEAKRYGVLYSALINKKTKMNDGIIDIMVRAEDASKINRIVERFKLSSYDEATIRSEIEKTMNEKAAKDLAQALKIAINSVYGLTAASFDNPFKDVRNKNNIVALRGALFMRTLQDEVIRRGFKIVAIKTDSIKIANATKEIVEFCMDFANSYGYTFEHEATYDRICQINDADYVALYKDSAWCEDTYGYIPGDNYEHEKTWTSTGAQFSVPYVFKTLFNHEQITFEDKCETKAVTTSMYLDMNEDLEEDEHDYQFVGKVGSFCPIKPGHGGGVLLREKDGKYSAVTGTKGYRWLEAETVTKLDKVESIDDSYYKKLVDTALDNISKHGDVEMFLNADKYYDIPF